MQMSKVSPESQAGLVGSWFPELSYTAVSNSFFEVSINKFGKQSRSSKLQALNAVSFLPSQVH
jgi:hypothetical protein